MNMENIFAQIDAIFQHETPSQQPPVWANEILQELREIKQLLQEQRQQSNSRISKDFYRFIQEFRRSMKADTQNNIYPTYHYENRKLGIDFKGWLYDKETTKYLTKEEAYKVYKHAYQVHLKEFSA